jgi:hypothetical protein
MQPFLPAVTEWVVDRTHDKMAHVRAALQRARHSCALLKSPLAKGNHEHNKIGLQGSQALAAASKLPKHTYDV